VDDGANVTDGCVGSVMETEAATADHHATAAGPGATSGKDLHRQVCNSDQLSISAHICQ